MRYPFIAGAALALFLSAGSAVMAAETFVYDFKANQVPVPPAEKGLLTVKADEFYTVTPQRDTLEGAINDFQSLWPASRASLLPEREKGRNLRSTCLALHPDKNEMRIVAGNTREADRSEAKIFSAPAFAKALPVQENHNP